MPLRWFLASRRRSSSAARRATRCTAPRPQNTAMPRWRTCASSRRGRMVCGRSGCGLPSSASLCTDSLGAVMALTGAVAGSLIGFILPGLIFSSPVVLEAREKPRVVWRRGAQLYWSASAWRSSGCPSRRYRRGAVLRGGGVRGGGVPRDATRRCSRHHHAIAAARRQRSWLFTHVARRCPVNRSRGPLVVRGRVVGRCSDAGVRFRGRRRGLGLDDAHVADGVLRRLLLLLRFLSSSADFLPSSAFFFCKAAIFWSAEGFSSFRSRVGASASSKGFRTRSCASAGPGRPRRPK